MVPAEDERLLCLFCGTRFGESTRICHECGHYNQAGARHCAACGAQILRDCPACGADNWVLADHCAQCGRDLALIERMAHRWQKTTQQRLYERQSAMLALKEREEKASQERMATLVEAERKRQEALAQARELQRQRDRQLYQFAGVAIIVFVAIVVLVLLLTSGGS
jgi:hypothetical protein